MKKILSLLVLISVAYASFGQADIARFNKTPLTGANQNKSSVVDYNLKVMSNLYVPKGNSFTLNNGKDSSSALRYQDVIKRLGVYNGTSWDTLAFSKDFANYMKIADGLTRLDSIKVIGLTVTAYAPITWRINAVNYQKLTNSVFNVPAATDGYNRIDLLYATTSNTVLRLQGTETTGIAVAPVLPMNTISVAFLYISGDVIQQPFPDLSGYVTTSYLMNNYYDKTKTLTIEESDARYIYANPSTPQIANINITGEIESNSLINNGFSRFNGQNQFNGYTGFQSAVDFNVGFRIPTVTTLGTSVAQFSNYSDDTDFILGINSAGTAGSNGGITVKNSDIYGRDGVRFLKEGDLTVTNIGTSGAATILGNVINIPIYSGGGGGGGVTSVSSANSDISVATGTTTPVLTLNSGTGANQIVKRDGSGNIADLANYYLASNPSGYISSFTETDPLFDTKFAGKTTTGLAEGTNLYYTATRFNTAFSGKSTTDLTEGTNLYFTQGRVSANTDVTANTASRHNAVTIGTANGLSLSTQVLSLGLASSGVTGALSGSDWSLFNGKFTLPTLTNGSILFSNGTTIAQDNANFFWDDTNNRLGIGTATPAYMLDVNAGAANGVARLTSSNASGIRLNNTATNGKEYNFGSDLDGHYYIYNETNGKYVLDVDQNGKWTIGETAQPINIPNLTASQAVFTDASKNLVSKATNGTGNVILSAGTLALVAGSTLTSVGAFNTTFTSTATTVATLPAGTNTLYSTLASSITSAQMASSVTNETGTGTMVFSISPTFTGTPLSTTAAATVLTTQIATTAFAGARLVLTANGTGAATTIVVPHGLTGITSTSYATAFPRNAASAGISYVTVDATNISVVYTVAPASGTGNLSYSVEIKP